MGRRKGLLWTFLQDKSGRSDALRHTLPDGSQHFDWMIERHWAPEMLVTFRLAVGTDLLSPGTFEAERIGDHRRAYLHYEGPVSGGRGEVRREGNFDVPELEDQPEFLRVILKPRTSDGRTVEWLGTKTDRSMWRFSGRDMLS